MSEAALKIHPSIDLEEFERRLRAGKQSRDSDNDPLAELARLVGEADPFAAKADNGRVAANGLRTQAQPARAIGNRIHQVYPPTEQPAGQDGFDGHSAPDISDRNLRSIDDAFDGRPIQLESETDAFSLRGSHYPDAAHEPTHGPADSFDAWDQFDSATEQDVTANQAHIQYAEEEAAPKRSARGVMLLIGILAAGAIGFGAALEMKGAGLPTFGPHSPPVILAGGPAKVAAISVADAGEDVSSSAILEKPVPGKPVQAKVVSTVEQPVDLSQQPKAIVAQSAPIATDPVAVIPAPAAVVPAKPDMGEREAALVNPQPITAASVGTSEPLSQNGFPQPKRVKVVSVRPDGSIIDAINAEMSAHSAPAMASAGSAWDPDAGKATTRATDPVVSSAPSTADSIVPPPVAAPRGLSKTKNIKTADAGPTASGESSISQTLATPQKTDVVKPKASRQVADLGATTATDATAAPDGDNSGRYSVQLSSSPTEKEARQSLNRLKKKFGAEIGRRKLTFHRVKLDDKTVYRVRVGNLTRDAANDICTKVQGSGGNCFVAASAKN